MSLRRLPVLCALSGLLAAPGIALAQDAPTAPTGPTGPTAERRVAPGVTAGGLPVGGLTLAETTRKIEAERTTFVLRGLILTVAGRPYRLTAETAKVRLDAARTARAALDAPSPAQDGGGGVAAKTGDVPLVVTHSSLAVKAWVAGVAKRSARAPRNATLKIGLKQLRIRRARAGHALGQAAAVKLVDAALDVAAASRILRAPVVPIRAKVNADDLRRQHGTVITISKSEFKLRLFKRFKLVKSYGVAIGQPAYPTPSGRFSIVNKQVNPVWSVPNSPWAGELQGTTVAGGSAANPLKARWMGIVNGVGIHGTSQVGSIGTRASHGCLRMRVPDVIALYKRVPVGTTVLIR